MTLNLPQGYNKIQIADNEDINLDTSKTKTVALSNLNNGDYIALKWKNGFTIKFTKVEDAIKVFKSIGGSYNELDYKFEEIPSELDNSDLKYFQEI